MRRAVVVALVLLSLAAWRTSVERQRASQRDGRSKELRVARSLNNGVADFADDVQRTGSWARAWCTVQPGASTEDLIAAMGTPSEQFDDLVTWLRGGVGFRAFIGESQLVRRMSVDGNLGINEADLTCARDRTSTSGPFSIEQGVGAAGQ